MSVLIGMSEDERYMRLALEEAETAYHEGEIPIGAVVVSEGRVIARAHNQVERLSDPTAHAELLAITSATEALGGKYLQGCTLYVTIEPCTMCAGALFWSRVDRIVYGAGEPKFGYAVHAPELFPRSVRLVRGILEDEARELMQRFFRSRR